MLFGAAKFNNEKGTVSNYAHIYSSIMKKAFRNSFLVVSSIATGMLTLLAQPANALVFNFSFTNEDGNIGTVGPDPTGAVVSGFVEFDSFATFADIANQSGVAADNVQITSVTGFTATTAPLFGDGGIELGVDFAGNFNVNSFSFDGSGDVSVADLRFSVQDGLGNFESLFLRDTFALLSNNDPSNPPISRINDANSSTLVFTQDSASAAVPFGFSPTLGLFLVGSLVTGKSYLKRRQARSLTEK